MTANLAKGADDQREYHDVIIVGAGMTGICQLHYLKQKGFDVIALERNADVGGTWYNNRYPGCRFDSESFTYAYSFSKELLEEWNWSERFAPQNETLRYTQYVAEKFQLRDNIQFNVSVKGAHFDEHRGRWDIDLECGRTISCRYLINCLGALSTPTLPRIEGVEEFKGESFHTFHWPHQGVDLAGKRVAVIGSGSTGVQVVSEIADKVESLTVFQRRPNWCAPLKNSAISAEEMADIRANYEAIFAKCNSTHGGFIHDSDPRGFYDVSREERLALWEKLYEEPGFGIWLANFKEIFLDEDANAEFSQFIADKIRQRVDDPEVAELLIPKDHGFGVQRVPLETNYYEAFNRDNVKLVSMLKEPIERITATGIATAESNYEFDMIVYATGFDAMTGAFDRIDFQGLGGQKLKDKWSDGPMTYLGMFVSGFPNMVTLLGPQSGSFSTNFPRAIEVVAGWTTDFIEHMRSRDMSCFDARPEAEEAWCEESMITVQQRLLRNAKSWFHGFNSNIEGHDRLKPRPYIYVGGNPKLVRRLSVVQQSGYEGVHIYS